MVWFGKANLQGEGGERIKDNEETQYLKWLEGENDGK